MQENKITLSIPYVNSSEKINAVDFINDVLNILGAKTTPIKDRYGTLAIHIFTDKDIVTINSVIRMAHLRASYFKTFSGIIDTVEDDSVKRYSILLNRDGRIECLRISSLDVLNQNQRIATLNFIYNDDRRAAFRRRFFNRHKRLRMPGVIQETNCIDSNREFYAHCDIDHDITCAELSAWFKQTIASVDDSLDTGLYMLRVREVINGKPHEWRIHYHQNDFIEDTRYKPLYENFEEANQILDYRNKLVVQTFDKTLVNQMEVDLKSHCGPYGARYDRLWRFRQISSNVCVNPDKSRQRPPQYTLTFWFDSKVRPDEFIDQWPLNYKDSDVDITYQGYNKTDIRNLPEPIVLKENIMNLKETVVIKNEPMNREGDKEPLVYVNGDSKLPVFDPNAEVPIPHPGKTVCGNPVYTCRSIWHYGNAIGYTDKKNSHPWGHDDVVNYLLGVLTELVTSDCLDRFDVKPIDLIPALLTPASVMIPMILKCMGNDKTIWIGDVFIYHASDDSVGINCNGVAVSYTPDSVHGEWYLSQHAFDDNDLINIDSLLEVIQVLVWAATPSED